MAYESPTPDDVARLVTARTRDTFGNQGSFGPNTRPTAVQVEGYIGTAERLMFPRMGELTPETEDLAAEVVAIRAAMLVEVAYLADEAVSGSPGGESLIPVLKSLLDEALVAFDSARVDAPEGSRIGALRVGTVYTTGRY